MVEAVIWLVVWAVLAFAGAWLAVALIGGGVALLGVSTDKFWLAPVGMGIGWIVGVAWFIFAAIRVVLQVIDVVQLATA